MDHLNRIDQKVARLEGLLLVAIIATMVSLSALQLILRRGFDFGFEWADLLVRQMVLWVGFVGGAHATYKGRHIAIDAVAKLLTDERVATIRCFTAFIASLVSLILLYAGVQFVMSEYRDNTTLFSDVPAWPAQIIIPVSFFLMAFHFFVMGMNQFWVARGIENPAGEGKAS